MAAGGRWKAQTIFVSATCSGRVARRCSAGCQRHPIAFPRLIGDIGREWLYDGARPAWGDWQVVAAVAHPPAIHDEADLRVLAEPIKVRPCGDDGCRIDYPASTDIPADWIVTVFVAARCLTSRLINYLLPKAPSALLKSSTRRCWRRPAAPRTASSSTIPMRGSIPGRSTKACSATASCATAGRQTSPRSRAPVARARRRPTHRRATRPVSARLCRAHARGLLRNPRPLDARAGRRLQRHELLTHVGGGRSTAG